MFNHDHSQMFLILLTAHHLTAQHSLFALSIYFLYSASLLTTQLQFWILQLHWHSQDILTQKTFWITHDWINEIVFMFFCYLIISTLLTNFFQKTSSELKNTAEVSWYWIKRKQSVLNLLRKWAQKISSEKIENQQCKRI